MPPEQSYKVVDKGYTCKPKWFYVSYSVKNIAHAAQTRAAVFVLKKIILALKYKVLFKSVHLNSKALKTAL